MTILQSLAGYYDRMAARGEAEPPGFSRERIGFAVVIDADGGVVAVNDLRDTTGKKPVAMQGDVPASRSRTGTGVTPFFLWDKSSYSLGVALTPDKRTSLQHEAFRQLHVAVLANVTDEGLLAFGRFLEGWSPERFAGAPVSPAMLDANIVFRLDGDTDGDGRPRFIHQRPAARPLIEARGGEGENGWCLIAGSEGPIARLHPVIKNVDGAQSSGAALVSFNLDAFGSWGRTQGANAPTGQAAAARYGAALNRLLDRTSQNRIQLVDPTNLDPSRKRPADVRHRQRFKIGDSTTVFWADAAGLREEILAGAEALAAMCMGEVAAADPAEDVTLDEDDVFAKVVRDQLQLLTKGEPATIGLESVPASVKIHILGLAPSAARLSVRFWMTQELGRFAVNLAQHQADCRIEPLPRGWGTGPAINRMLFNTVAAQAKWDNIPPLLAGEVARAVLGGTPYPRTWLSSAIMRLRAGDPKDANGRNAEIGWHAAAIRAVLQRSTKEGAPVSLDKEEKNPAYRLGRLFAVLETAQYNALGRVNATIRDRYFGAASATPARVFPLLMRGGQNHLAVLRKEGKSGGIERDLEEIIGGLATTLPRSLKLEDQGRFAIGYYHQRAARFTKKDAVTEADQTDQGDA